MIELAALLTAASVVVKLLVFPGMRALRSAYRGGRQAVDVVDTLAEIAKEFKPNGGSSLRDVINRVLENQNVDHRVLDELKTYVHNRFHSYDADIAALTNALKAVMERAGQITELRDLIAAMASHQETVAAALNCPAVHLPHDRYPYAEHRNTEATPE